MRKGRFLIMSVTALCAMAAIVSCSKSDEMFDDSALQETQAKNYAENFEAKYGKIAPTQKWDFTTGERRLTRGFTTIKTEVLENGIDFGDVSKLEIVSVSPQWMHSEIRGGAEKNDDLLTAIATALPEKKKWEGKPVVLVAPSNGFYIFPLFLGGRLTFDLKVKVGDQEPVTVFEKNWINFQTINGMQKDTSYGDGSVINMKGIYIEAPVGTPVEVFIDNIYDQTYKRPFPSPAGTTNGRAVYVDIPEGVKPELPGIQLKENSVIKYIGIEDIAASGAPESSDSDFNDVVLAVVGNPDVPQESIITNDTYEVRTCRGKRYMIEDLGAVDDFDFNDVVVDVEEYTVTTHTVTYENGVLKTDVETSVATEPTKALLRCMGGTLDFELNIGDTKWVKSENGFNVKSMYNTQGNVDYNKVLAEFEVTGYDYNANNIGIKVDGEKGQVFEITFPKAGTAPMIIAVDPTQNWMKERISVPKEWFTEE